MTPRWFPLVAAVTVAAPLSLAAQSGSFVTLLGRDTIAVERYTRTGSAVDGMIVRRSPQTTLTKYGAVLNADGTVAKYTQVTTRGDGTPLANGSIPLTLTFSGDTVVREVQASGQPVTFRRAVPRGTFPAAGGALAITQLLVTAARAGAAVNTIGFAGTDVGPAKADIRMLGSDSAEVVAGGFRTGYRLDRDGRVQRVDGSLTTQKFIATATKAVDVEALARAWAAKDAAGQPMGATSTRDTLRATVGTAVITIDYGRPAKRGREVWGKLVPFDTTWRFGANAAAILRTDKPLDIGGTTIPAGAYSLWLYPSAGQSLLIVNSQVGQWGTAYDVTKDVARIPVQKQATRVTPEERYTVSVEGGKLLMTWDRDGYAVPISEKP
ncbi:MAG TPA: DUF2911 domain-containing protein [Gemmatimonadaceae bacterium]|nr:DUF2911 domain-containing protein [Gemmatimonadaceae bacterium]